MQHYVGLLAIVVSTLLALGTAALLAPRLGLALPTQRHAPIDGLRGFAALFVFFCHAALWLYFAKTGLWGAPVRLYGNLGLGGVIVFFMITAYLFITKLLGSRARPMDWFRLYASRVLRLTPLYLFALLVVLTIVAVSTGWSIRQTPGELASGVVQWLSFNIWGTPDLNGMSETWMTIAGVTWSLRYEWAFYLLLPLMGMLLKVRAPWLLVASATALAGQIAWTELHASLAAPFLGGIAAAWLAPSLRWRAWALHRLAAWVAVGAFFTATAVFHNPLKPVPLFLMAVTFAIVSGGNSLYGVLTSRPARWLGEVSYSMYLLHGIALFVLVHGVIGLDTLRDMSPWMYWMIVVIVTPILVTSCLLTFRWIERPAMQSVDRVITMLRKRAAPVHAAP